MTPDEIEEYLSALPPDEADAYRARLGLASPPADGGGSGNGSGRLWRMPPDDVPDRTDRSVYSAVAATAAARDRSPETLAREAAKVVGSERVTLGSDGSVYIQREDGSEVNLRDLPAGMSVVEFLAGNPGKLGGAIVGTALGGPFGGALGTALGSATEDAYAYSRGAGRSLGDAATGALKEGAMDLAATGLFGLGAHAASKFRDGFIAKAVGAPDRAVIEDAKRSGIRLSALESTRHPKALGGWIARNNPEAFREIWDHNVARSHEFLDRALSMHGTPAGPDEAGDLIRRRLEDAIETTARKGKELEDEAWDIARSAGGMSTRVDIRPAISTVYDEIRSISNGLSPERLESHTGLKWIRDLAESTMRGIDHKGSLSVGDVWDALKSLRAEKESIERGTSVAFNKSMTRDQAIAAIERIRKSLFDVAEASGREMGSAGSDLVNAIAASKAKHDAVNAIKDSTLARLVAKKESGEAAFEAIKRADPSTIRKVFGEMSTKELMPYFRSLPEDVSGTIKATLIDDALAKVMPMDPGAIEADKIIPALYRALADRKLARRLDALGVPLKDTNAMRRSLSVVIGRNPVAGSPTALGNSTMLGEAMLAAGGAAAAAGQGNIAKALGIGYVLRNLSSRNVAKMMANPEARGLVQEFLRAGARLPRERGARSFVKRTTDLARWLGSEAAKRAGIELAKGDEYKEEVDRRRAEENRQFVERVRNMPTDETGATR